MKTALNIIGNYFLNLFALCLLALLYIPNGFVQIYLSRKKKRTLYHSANMQFNDAKAIDIFGAELYREFWNTTTVKPDGVLFSPYITKKTISWYLAVNKEKKTLTKFGLVLYYLIIIFDFTTWGKGGHFNFYKNNKKNKTMKTTIKKFAKNTYKHFIGFFIIMLLITLLWSDFNKGLQLFGQILVGFVLSCIANWGFEIYQKNKGGTNTFIQILEDCLSAGIGGIIGVLIANLFI